MKWMFILLAWTVSSAKKKNNIYGTLRLFNDDDDDVMICRISFSRSFSFVHHKLWTGKNSPGNILAVSQYKYSLLFLGGCKEICATPHWMRVFDSVYEYFRLIKSTHTNIRIVHHHHHHHHHTPFYWLIFNVESAHNQLISRDGAV